MPTVNINSWHIWAANFTMCITYYDKKEQDIKHIRNVEDMVISLDHETGLLTITYQVNRVFLSVNMPITSSIAIDNEK